MKTFAVKLQIKTLPNYGFCRQLGIEVTRLSNLLWYRTRVKVLLEAILCSKFLQFDDQRIEWLKIW